MRRRGKIYDACGRYVLLYGSESWPMNERILAILPSCDRRMLRYMAEVADRCGVDLLELVVRRRRLQWF